MAAGFIAGSRRALSRRIRIMPNAWLITQDRYIDRRIFFFAAALQELGYEARVFAGFTPEDMYTKDPAGVLRPEITTAVESACGASDMMLADVSDATLREVLSAFKDAQTRYRARNGRHAETTEELATCGWHSNGHCQVEMLASSDTGYVVGACRPHGEFTYIYQSAIDRVTMDSRRTDPALVALRSAILRETAPTGAARIAAGLACEAAANALGPAAIHVLRDGPRMLIRAGRADDRWIFEFDASDGIIVRRDFLPYTESGNDEVLGSYIDFSDFRRDVYPYSPILLRVKQELATGADRRPDLVYVADLPTLPIGILLKRSLGCKLIVDCHEWWREQAALWLPDNKPSIDASDRYERMLYPACDVRITVGGRLAERMSSYFGCPFEHIYSCLTDDSALPCGGKADAFWSRECGLPAGARVAVFQGSLTPLRNLDTVARATKYLDEGHYLVIVGDGNYRAEFERILHEEGNPDRCRFTGWVGQDRLMEFTVNGHVGLLPYVSVNHYYALSVPNKLLEYLSAKIPILTDESLLEVSRLVRDCGVGVCAACGDPRQLGEAINRVLGDEAFRARIRVAYENLGDRYSPAGQKRVFAGLIQRMMGS